jgi:cytochrome c oxidase cbb3-type subunit III
MSSRSRASLAMVALLALAACDREERDARGKPLPEGPANLNGDPRAAEYENNAFHIAQGQRLFAWFNCSGCHSHGGGGMGPPLMDDEWRYGGRIDQIAASIAEGRPNGMPSWRAKLTNDQIWQLAAFVRSMSGQPSKDAVPSRSDEMSTTTPQTLTPREPAHTSDTAEQ